MVLHLEIRPLPGEGAGPVVGVVWMHLAPMSRGECYLFSDILFIVGLGHPALLMSRL